MVTWIHGILTQYLISLLFLLCDNSWPINFPKCAFLVEILFPLLPQSLRFFHHFLKNNWPLIEWEFTETNKKLHNYIWNTYFNFTTNPALISLYFLKWDSPYSNVWLYTIVGHLAVHGLETWLLLTFILKYKIWKLQKDCFTKDKSEGEKIF